MSLRTGAGAVLFLLAGLGSIAGCVKDHTREEAERVSRDRAALAMVAQDETRIQALFAAEGAAEKAHRDDEAAGMLEGQILPAVTAAVDKANALSLESAWGKGRRDELVSAFASRREELARYVVTLRAHDQEAQLESAVRQQEIERRVLTATSAIEGGSR